MSDGMNEAIDGVGRESRLRAEMMERLLAVADAGRVFGPPIVSGEQTVITAAEIAASGGFGSGMGFGYPRSREETPAVEDRPADAETPEAGGGGGGGGGSLGRPVAVITVGPEGVTVRPVLDLTKLGLAGTAAVVVLAALTLKRLRRR